MSFQKFFTSKDELDVQAAKTIAESIMSLLKKQEHVVFATAGGRSVATLFQRLSLIDSIPWEKIHIFMVDERIVPLDHSDSNFKLVKMNLIDNIASFPKENVHPFIISKNDSDYGVSKYETELKKYGGLFDIVLLSAGEDGHIGGIFPHHRSFDDEEKSFIFINDSPKAPSKRMSLTKILLTKAQVGILIFAGEGKRYALESYFNTQLTAKDCPAKLINLLPEFHVFTTIKRKENALKKEIVPALMAKSQNELDYRINRVRSYSTRLQMDVVDNKFAANISNNFNFCSYDFDVEVPAGTCCHIEAQLMVIDPDIWVDKLSHCVDTFLIHIESVKNPFPLIKKIKLMGKRVGLALNPDTPIETILPYLNVIDQVLVMTVVPGFYGSPFLSDALDKIKTIRKINTDIDIEVDGGINDTTITQALDAGANIFVSGSYVMKSDNIEESIEILKKKIGDYNG